MKLKIHTKLFLGFIIIMLITVIIVAFVTDKLLVREFHSFQNDMMVEKFRGFDVEPPESPFVQNLRRNFLLTAIIGSSLAIIASFIFARYIVSPIKKVIDATTKIAKGNYNHSIKTKAEDEVGDLCKSVNKMAESLKKTETLRKELISNVSHELATPLTNISGYLEALYDGTIQGEKDTKKTLMVLKEETERLKSMADDMRALSYAEKGNSQTNPQHFNLQKLINDIKTKIRPKYKKKNISVKVNISKNLPKIFVDKNKFTQIIMNLLNNAINFTPKNGKIEISATKEKKYIQISVSDTGRGISEKDLPHIFERFYRTDKSRSRKTGGIGVGLAIVKELVEAHEGTIEVKSKVGKGSCFICKFPVI